MESNKPQNELDKIFIPNPSLLEKKEVKDLIEYCQSVHARNLSIGEKAKQENDQVNNILIHSNRFLIKGYSDKETVDKLMELLESNFE